MKWEKEITNSISKWFSGQDIFPYEVRLSPTNDCNLACLPCVSRGRPLHRPEGELSKAVYLRIVKEAAELKVRGFDICGGGEPFMRCDVTLDIMRKIKELGMAGSVSTNGTLFTEDMIEEIVRIGWDEIRFSINGPNEEIDDAIRGVKGAFKKSTEAIRNIVRIRKELNRNTPSIILMPILTRLNYDKLCEFVGLAHSLGVNSLIFQPFMSETPPDPRGVDEKIRKGISQKLILRDAEVEKLQASLKEANELSERYNLHNNFNFLRTDDIKKTTDTLISSDSKKSRENPMLAVPCYVPWWLIDINTTGGVSPCSGYQTRENVKEKSLKEIWFGKNFEDLRKVLASGQVPNVCKICCAISVIDNRKIRENLSQTCSNNEQNK
jgi:MoaA/NifB/PqqE/SkfB family radical SAM enzyme